MRILLALLAVLALGGCRWGEPPRVPYVDGTVYVEPDGTRTPIRGQAGLGVTAVTPYADGLLVADGRWFEGSLGLAQVSADRRTELGPCSTGGGVLSPDRRQVTWLTLGCPESLEQAPAVVHVANVDGTDGTGSWTRELSQRSLLSVAGFVGDAVVVSGWRDPVRLVARSGPTTVVPHLRRAVDAHGTLVVGDERVVDTATGELLWQVPGRRLVAFSPDGRRLVGFDGARAVLVDALTGAVTATLPGRLDGLAWEDERHLLGTSRVARLAVPVRIGLDGRAELVGPARPDSGPAWVFAD